MTQDATFDLLPLKFHFKSHKVMHFAPGTIGNVLRGKLGKNLKHLSCEPDCADSATCSLRETCDYARWFAPVAAAGPSGLYDRPRPFVLRASHLDGVTVGTGEAFCIGLNLFEMNALDLFQKALGMFAPLQSVDGTIPLRLRLRQSDEVKRVRIRFLTPTELKGCSQPDFGPLFSRVRDRVSILRSLYGAGPLDVDFKAMGERAAQIRMTHCELRHTSAERVNRSTGQRHSLGGFIGCAEYEGDLGEFMPYLKIARWTGVGRQTVWGKGEIDCETF